ncbi:MAG: hydroxymethylpyrimidine/phosphomethylpyrimidine kinase [Gammaproteobacteria bacterium]|jgi:hydroxymethylpyrimidine/phosphomethylpyrimidine kinase|nr:hydroxymethylpyrimidine/phosphomethylpyrimidine kinase [Gammaproteobacteria bacterium]HJN95264.1 hydroxymethylpyrimidine/phosphomethylpyrimidine kinase [Gammaproteobacteria bacterium]|tara:strand:+ start:8402 stop:9196 length:795 start_codon:yes stop_codon:yes gene_type:complete
MIASKPSVMCFSGLDPTGGAGLQADIETLFSIGCHCAPIATALTVQNTQNAISMTATEPALLVQQARAILEDMSIQCFKVGLVGSVESIEVLHTLIKDYPGIPVVVDPIAIAGGGYEFGGTEVLEATRDLLLPLATVMTPNTDEIRVLAPTADTLDACANELLDLGCQHLLLTGTHAQTEGVINRLYSIHQDIALFNWPRLEHSYHGSGCTLAAAIAGYLAHKLNIHDAIQQAQRFTWESLSHGYRMGFGQHLPNRSYWNKQKL